jgi:hypothetical protein
LKPPRRLFRDRPARDDLSDIFNVETFVMAARLMAAFYIDKQGLPPDAVREKVRSHARYSFDHPWRGVLPVPFDLAQQETVYNAMVRAVEDVLRDGLDLARSDVPLVKLASNIATFLIDHDPAKGQQPEAPGGGPA